jgi:glycosyltransferase 2 family protein
MARVLRIALLVASTAAALALFLVVAHPRRLAASLAALPPSALLAAVGATMAGVMLGAVRWRLLLGAAGVRTSSAKLFASLTIGAAVNNLVPARGGDAVRLESAHQLTRAPRLAVAGTMVSERILDALVLALLVIVGSLATGGGPFLWVGIAVGSGVLLAAAVLGRQGGRLLRGRLAGLADGVAIFRSARVAAPALAITVGIWLGDLVMYRALAHGFGLDCSLAALLLLVGAGNLALAVPGAAAGLGSFELVTLAGAHGIGASGAALPAFVLARHAVIILPPTLTGLVLARTALPKAFGVRAPAAAAASASLPR